MEELEHSSRRTKPYHLWLMTAIVVSAGLGSLSTPAQASTIPIITQQRTASSHTAVVQATVLTAAKVQLKNGLAYLYGVSVTGLMLKRNTPYGYLTITANGSSPLLIIDTSRDDIIGTVNAMKSAEAGAAGVKAPVPPLAAGATLLLGQPIYQVVFRNLIMGVKPGGSITAPEGITLSTVQISATRGALTLHYPVGNPSVFHLVPSPTGGTYSPSLGNTGSLTHTLTHTTGAKTITSGIHHTLSSPASVLHHPVSSPVKNLVHKVSHTVSSTVSTVLPKVSSSGSDPSSQPSSPSHATSSSTIRSTGTSSSATRSSPSQGSPPHRGSGLTSLVHHLVSFVGGGL